MVDYPFAERLYPGILDAVQHVGQWGRTVVLSDGDAVFQPRKVERSGLWKAFDGEILIYIHKEPELDDVERLYPAKRYVLIDDKLRILAAVKNTRTRGGRVATVFPRQGHYRTILRPSPLILPRTSRWTGSATSSRSTTPCSRHADFEHWRIRGQGNERRGSARRSRRTTRASATCMVPERGEARRAHRRRGA